MALYRYRPFVKLSMTERTPCRISGYLDMPGFEQA